MAHEEGPQGSLREEWGALLGRDVLTASHATVDLEVQGFALLLGSKKETEQGDKMSLCAGYTININLATAGYLETQAQPIPAETKSAGM